MYESLEFFMIGCGSLPCSQFKTLINADLEVVRQLEILMLEGQRGAQVSIKPVLLKEEPLVIAIELEPFISLEKGDLNTG